MLSDTNMGLSKACIYSVFLSVMWEPTGDGKKVISLADNHILLWDLQESSTQAVVSEKDITVTVFALDSLEYFSWIQNTLLNSYTLRNMTLDINLLVKYTKYSESWTIGSGKSAIRVTSDVTHLVHRSGSHPESCQCSPLLPLVQRSWWDDQEYHLFQVYYLFIE